MENQFKSPVTFGRTDTGNATTNGGTQQTAFAPLATQSAAKVIPSKASTAPKERGLFSWSPRACYRGEPANHPAAAEVLRILSANSEQQVDSQAPASSESGNRRVSDMDMDSPESKFDRPFTHDASGSASGHRVADMIALQKRLQSPRQHRHRAFLARSPLSTATCSPRIPGVSPQSSPSNPPKVPLNHSLQPSHSHPFSLQTMSPKTPAAPRRQVPRAPCLVPSKLPKPHKHLKRSKQAAMRLQQRSGQNHHSRYLAHLPQTLNSLGLTSRVKASRVKASRVKASRHRPPLGSLCSTLAHLQEKRR